MPRRVSPKPALPPAPSGREQQKQRTRAALVEAARSLIGSGGEVTMPAIARGAGVSEATAYRHFPDLLAVLMEGTVGVWPDVETALPGLVRCADPVQRIGLVTRFLADNVLRMQGAVRAMIALTMTRPGDTVGARPAHRIDLIDTALAPIADVPPDRLSQLKRSLGLVVSAESLFTLLDLYRLDPEAAVAEMVATAQALVRAALSVADPLPRLVETDGPSLPR